MALFLVEGRVESVEVLRIQFVRDNPQPFAEMIHLSNSRQTQCFLGFGGFFVCRKTKPDWADSVALFR